jgi:hypothetical protein
VGKQFEKMTVLSNYQNSQLSQETHTKHSHETIKKPYKKWTAEEEKDLREQLVNQNNNFEHLET